MTDSSATAPMTAADLALKRSGELTNVVVPYRYEEYDKLLYKAGVQIVAGVERPIVLEKRVANLAEETAARAEGWSADLSVPVTVDTSPSKKGK